MSTTTKTSPAPRMTQREVRELPEAAPGLAYFAIGAYCWGRDTKAIQAVRKARSEGGNGEFTLHLANNTAEVASMDGGLFYDKSTPGLMLNVGRVKA